MKLFIAVVVLCAAVVFVKSDEATVSEKGHCSGREDNLGPLAKGEIKRLPQQCATATCQDDKTIRYEACVTPIFAQGCGKIHETPVDLSKPYPECCSKVTCEPE